MRVPQLPADLPAPKGLLHPSAQEGAHRPASTASGLAAAFARLPLGVADTFLLWLERFRQRRALGALSDHMLKDLGLSRSDAGRESGKRFWEG